MDKQTIGIFATIASILVFFLACLVTVAPVATTWAIVPDWIVALQEVARSALVGSDVVMTIGTCLGLGD